MKTPRDIADVMNGRKTAEMIRETFRAPPAEARKRLKWLFEEYPTAAYLTVIETWRKLGQGGLVEFTTKRLDIPVDDMD